VYLFLLPLIDVCITHNHTFKTHIEISREDHNVIDGVGQQHGCHDDQVHLNLGGLVQLFLEGQEVEMADKRETAVRNDGDDVFDGVGSKPHAVVCATACHVGAVIAVGVAGVDEDRHQSNGITPVKWQVHIHVHIPQMQIYVHDNYFKIWPILLH